MSGIKWGTTDIGATYGPPRILTPAEIGMTSSAVGNPASIATVGATATEPTPGTFRFHIPPVTMHAPNVTGMVIPVSHAPVPLDDRLYKWMVDAVSYTKAVGTGTLSPFALSVSIPITVSTVGNDKETAARTAVQVNADILLGLRIVFVDLVWDNKMTPEFTLIEGQYDPPAHVWTEGGVVIKNIRLVRQEVTDEGVAAGPNVLHFRDTDGVFKPLTEVRVRGLTP